MIVTLIEVLREFCLGRLRKTKKTSVRIAGVPTEIRNDYLPNTSLQRYRYAYLLLASYPFLY
jgi:hypothetical protein